MCVTAMLHVSTVKEVSSAPVAVGTLVMASPAQVCCMYEVCVKSLTVIIAEP